MTVHRFWHSSFNSPPYPIIDRYVSESYGVIDWELGNLPLDIRSLIESSSKFLEDPSDMARHVSNVARLYILRSHGGIYIDHDIIPLVNLEHFPRPFAATYAPDNPSVWSCLLGFPPEHPTIIQALNKVAECSTPSSVADMSGSHLIDSLRPLDLTFVPLACDGTGLPLPNQYNAVAFHMSSTSFPRSRSESLQ